MVASVSKSKQEYTLKIALALIISDYYDQRALGLMSLMEGGDEV